MTFINFRKIPLLLTKSNVHPQKRAQFFQCLHMESCSKNGQVLNWYNEDKKEK